MDSRRLEWLIVLCAAVLATGPAMPAAGADAIRSAGGQDQPVDFERDVRPILTGRCLQCHGPGEGEGGLRFTNLETALAELDSGERAIVPGQPEASELLQRVTAEDAALRMPPQGEPLSDAEVDVLRRWIAQGADWPVHWAYRPLTKPESPRIDAEHGDWPRTPIDSFVLARLQERGLRPSPPADRRTLLRRVTFDLTGLPPTPHEMRAFLADESPDAFERVVDRLLASPRYGERWARHWMDVARYAESHGHDQDRPRPNAWPYRDYLIRSFNADKPYARFVQEQLAGDVLFPDDPDGIVALGFLAAGPWDESSLRDIQENTLDRQIARYLDRDDMLTTALSTFVSSTVHCARCHDHKFDPIPQEEYYRLQAVFAGADKAERAYDPDPQIAARRRTLRERRTELPALRERLDASLLNASVQAEVAAWEKELASSAPVWTVLEPETLTSANGAMLTKQADGSVLAGGERPETDIYTVTVATDLRGITGVRLELLTDEGLPHNGPGRQDNGNLHLNGFQVFAAPRHDPDAAQRITLQNPRADFNQQGWTVEMAIDGNPATAWGIFPEVGKPHRAVFEFKEPLSFDADVTLTFRLEQTHGGGHLIGRPRLAVTTAPCPLPLEADALPSEITEILATSPADRTPRQQADLAAFVLERRIERDLAALPPQQKVYVATSQFEPDKSFAPAKVPRPIHLLRRGEITQPGDPVSPGTLSCLPGLEHEFDLPDPDDEGSRRAALARWMSDPRNVLAWRSIVNRVWHYHFGRGLVATPNDFGLMGASPTHPELLDWLAVTFRESEGSLKDLHRMIVTSAVYRQSSQHRPEGAAADADNRLLWRMNRRRLDAESVRDAILHVSGQLDCTMGGPSVKQFVERPGVHVTPVVDYLGFDADDPANRRRSVYRFIFRTLPDPFMESLDCADASQLTPVRNESVTALQALAMLNNEFVILQSEHLAERAADSAGDLPTRLRLIYELTLGRPPRQDELEVLAAYATRHGLPNACRVVLNSNEFLFVD